MTRQYVTIDIRALRDRAFAALHGQLATDGGNLVHGLPRWGLQPVTLCALFSGPSRLTPKVEVLLDCLEEYRGTARDPRLHGADPKALFTNRSTSEIAALSPL
jgi:hypothetical protein